MVLPEVDLLRVHLSAWCCCRCRRGLHVTSIVRGPSDAAARERLRASFGSADPALLAAFDELAESQLTVLAGDSRTPKR